MVRALGRGGRRTPPRGRICVGGLCAEDERSDAFRLSRRRWRYWPDLVTEPGARNEGRLGGGRGEVAAAGRRCRGRRCRRPRRERLGHSSRLNGCADCPLRRISPVYTLPYQASVRRRRNAQNQELARESEKRGEKKHPRRTRFSQHVTCEKCGAGRIAGLDWKSCALQRSGSPAQGVLQYSNIFGES